MALLAAAVTGGLAASAYLDGKFQLRRDVTALLKLRKAGHEYEKALKADHLSPWYILAETCKRQPNDRAIWTRERSWSFQELHDQVVRYAQFLLEQGIRPGDLVGMYLHNSAEFVFIMFAALTIGGEILVAVPSRDAFGGYWRNEEATNKRFATDVFKAGDLYYRCGDALRRSPDGHWYFLDRLGDTFRWKSENVSTAEVAEALGRYPGVTEANVYGVTVPGHEGRAGCAALHLEGQPDENFVSGLLQYSKANLPRYAVPVFLRVVKHSSHIHNHKQNKVGLRQEGIDLEKLGVHERDGADDMIMWQKPGSETYVPFQREDWEALSKGGARL
ncbi:hypothetical protein LTR48_004656 [Friedmanniomyces endolithicus]|uniref:AMP-dependent synthetase/ligase domain-containing protein n=1 Tax=Rachicladosporium monterosium TaxID=1507873 RepID=A0ABR0L4M8_9PEZI|nr:hypothetical protein LTR48_004656 [Friedmanniomyces endolithicus]KAK5143449.1 hypothetical protein LTR32_004427 [Rachicladosporium monterosium]